MEANKHHPEMSVCVEHGKIWQTYGGLGVCNLDSEFSTIDQTCGICQNPSIYRSFLTTVKDECTRGMLKSPDVLRAEWQKTTQAFAQAKQQAIREAKKAEPGKEFEYVTHAREAMQKRFFIYMIVMWELGQQYRESIKDMSDSDESDASREVLRQQFSRFVSDYTQFKQKDISRNETARGGPFMYCDKHQAIGHAVPWMRTKDYKEDCMICTSDERKKHFQTEKAASYLAVRGNNTYTTGEFDYMFKEAEQKMAPSLQRR